MRDKDAGSWITRVFRCCGSDDHAGATWAPIGKNPVVTNTGARYSINMLSVVSARGALRFMLRDGTVNSGRFIEFWKRCSKTLPAPVS
ncbi:transposase [Nocardia sp. NPDC051570]|uniref:transposase n=1 Tax=Nocardia sp. NPDC051570 TaxID=3364324 RepID=UPI0037B7C53A